METKTKNLKASSELSIIDLNKSRTYSLFLTNLICHICMVEKKKNNNNSGKGGEKTGLFPTWRLEAQIKSVSMGSKRGMDFLSRLINYL